MDDNYEQDMISRLMQLTPGRRMECPEGCAWGNIFLPAKNENPHKGTSGFRVVLMGSWLGGELAFAAISKLEREMPGELQLVGVATDDPLSTDAKISAKKRFWNLYQPDIQEKYVLWFVDSVLSFGVPCFTGKVKSQVFHDLLAQWKPDALLVCVFGQILDSWILNFPKYGIYNLHPSDLLHNHGAGAHPWEDLFERNETITKTTIHIMSEEVDRGAVVGQSPPICVATSDGKLTKDASKIIEKGMSPVLSMVRALFLKLVENKENGASGAVTSMNFEDIFTESQKKELLAPLP